MLGLSTLLFGQLRLTQKDSATGGGWSGRGTLETSSAPSDPLLRRKEMKMATIRPCMKEVCWPCIFSYKCFSPSRSQGISAGLVPLERELSWVSGGGQQDCGVRATVGRQLPSPPKTITKHQMMKQVHGGDWGGCDKGQLLMTSPDGSRFL